LADCFCLGIVRLDFSNIVSEYFCLEKLSGGDLKLKKENQKEFSEELFNKLGKENADKKNEFVNALQINWSENINQAVNDL